MVYFKQIYVLKDQSYYIVCPFDAFGGQINADIEKSETFSSSPVISTQNSAESL